MTRLLPEFAYPLEHPHPNGHVFSVLTVVLVLFTMPILVLVNLVTQGSELVPSLHSNFQPNDTFLDSWWGTRRLPPLLRPDIPDCEPKDLGRGDMFRISASLFDYTVMSTWNTSDGPQASGVQEQKRVEYRGESFANCSVNSARFDYSLVEQTQSVNDFIGQYYGPGLSLLNITDANPSDYRKLVLAVLEVISTDSLTIMRGQHLSNPALSMRITFDVDPNTAEPIPEASTLTYVNGTQPKQYPPEAFIYKDTIYNLVTVAIDAVNLDLGSNISANVFRNASRLNDRNVISPNLPPPGVQPADWAEESQSYYYGNITPPYRTWAEMLIAGKPVTLGSLTGLPEESVMVTTYLCPSYQLKPIDSLLSSLFTGSASMFLSVWGAWVTFVIFVAKKMPVRCGCLDCKIGQWKEDKPKKEERKKAEAENPLKFGMLTKLLASLGFAKQAKPTSNASDEENAVSNDLPYNGRVAQSQRPCPSEKYPSYVSGSTTKES
ncbi:hypothetical protein FRC09_000053 [Ceratobasidium sp. 395]|nr:hypothetical protein FRC09_000053 [Ceratobasidium sp. 395]